MKIAAYNSWRLAVVTMALWLGAASAGWSQQGSAGAWAPRMAALQEEQDTQAGVAVSIVFDDSGSMNDNHKLLMAKRAFRAWIERAPDNYRFGLVALNAGELVPLQRNDRARILAAVNGLEASGDTPLARTIAGAGAAIRQRRVAGTVYERQVVVILTDGEDTTSRGIKGVKEEIGKLRANNVEVIAFGYQGEGDYMRGSATHFYSPENEQDISQGLNAIGSEIGDTSDVVVDDATRAKMLTMAAPVPNQNALAPPDAAPAAVSRGTPFSPYGTPSPVATPKPARVRVRHGGIPSSYWIAGILIACALLNSRRKRR